jgi:hypothetical protein
MTATAIDTMIAATIRTNEIPELFTVGVGVGVGLRIICAELKLTNK